MQYGKQRSVSEYNCHAHPSYATSLLLAADLNHSQLTLRQASRSDVADVSLPSCEVHVSPSGRES